MIIKLKNRPKKEGMKYIKSTPTIFYLYLLLLAASTTSAKDISIATFALDTLQVDSAIAVMAPIYQRIGYDMLIVRFPGKRSLVEANKGTTEGELIRIAAIQEVYPNLIRIPYAISSVKVMSVTLSDQSVINNRSDMFGRRVGVLRGVEVFETLTQYVQREIVNSIDSLFELLLSGRVDAILFTESDVKKYIKNNGLSERVKIGNKPILELPLYHFVNKNHQEIIEKLNREMQMLEESGELQALIKSAHN